MSQLLKSCCIKSDESPQITPDLTAAHSKMPIFLTQNLEQLHENWEVAVRIAAAFPSARRVADLAGGNGLLGWMLLLLDSTDSLSVLCVDKVLTHESVLTCDKVLFC